MRLEIWSMRRWTSLAPPPIRRVTGRLPPVMRLPRPERTPPQRMRCSFDISPSADLELQPELRHRVIGKVAGLLTRDAVLEVRLRVPATGKVANDECGLTA